MSHTPQISVIVPCYNQANFLPETLAGLQAQTFTDWECIIVNDGSPDHTRDVGQEWVRKDSRFRYIEKTNGGLSSARNSGLKVALGNNVQFLDADDCIEPGKFAWQVKVLNDNPGVGIVYSDVRYFTTEELQLRRFTLSGPDEPWLEPLWLSGRPFIEKLLGDNMMAVNCAMVRGSVIETVGFFDETLDAAEDWHFWLRCAAAGIVFQYAPAPETLALVRIHKNSATNNRALMERGMFELRVRIGRDLTDGKLREINFNQGISRLPSGGCFSDLYHLTRLALANRYAGVTGFAARVYLWRHPGMSRFIRLFRRRFQG